MHLLLTRISKDERRPSNQYNSDKTQEGRRSICFTPWLLEYEIRQHTCEYWCSRDKNRGIAQGKKSEGAIDGRDWSEVDAAKESERNALFSFTDYIGIGVDCWRKDKDGLEEETNENDLKGWYGGVWKLDEKRSESEEDPREGSQG